MSVKMMGLVWDTHLPRDMKFILLAYADHADHDGNSIFPAVSTIMKKTGYSERSVQRITAKLEKEGYLIQDGMGPHGTNKWRMGLSKLRGAKITGVQKEAPNDDGGGAKIDAQMAPKPSLKPSVTKDKPSVVAERTNPDILKIVSAATGMVAIPPGEMERIEQIHLLVDNYGVEGVTEAMKTAFQSWIKQKRQNGQGKYRRTNFGWVDWAQEELAARGHAPHETLQENYKIVLPNGEIAEVNHD